MKLCTLLLLMLALTPAWGATLLVKNAAGDPLPQAMVTRTPQERPAADLSDDGYAPDGVTNTAATVVTRFTDASGRVSFADTDQPAGYRVRAQGHVDVYLTELPEELVLQTMTEEQLFASYPSNVWLSQLHFGGDEALKNSFELNCAFCHQQASPFMRNERTPEQWLSVIERMNTYGARCPRTMHKRSHISCSRNIANCARIRKPCQHRAPGRSTCRQSR